MQKLLLAILITCTQGLLAQQTVRGKITDFDTKSPLIGAICLIEHEGEQLSGMTDMDGNYRINDVPVGRVNIQFIYSGYEDKLLPNTIITIAKEKILDIELVESVQKIEAVKITVKAKKNEVANDMATSSSRTFSVEETKRYAGSFNDPARMVSAFAGVTPNASGDNDIVVRGNSSRGIHWRLEGIEIPNPNHFGSEGATGGPINALNSSMLSNSEFYSGAFAPEYGNAFSGVFDMKLRKGNNEKRETSIGIGVLGLDVTTEGPFSKNSRASYLVNYRYSSLALLDESGLVDFGGVPKYQDAAFKVFLPTKRFGTFSLFGMGGLSSISQKEYEDEEETILKEDVVFNSRMGVTGINNTLLLGKNTYLKSSLSLSGNGNGTDYNNTINGIYQKEYEDDLSRYEIKGATTFNHKFNKNHKLQTGVIYTHYNFNYTSDFYNHDHDQFMSLLSEKGDAGMVQAFTSWKYRIASKLTLVTGAHYSHFLLNDQNSIEPRAGLKWQATKKHSINAGFGLHSKLESFTIYFAKDINGVQVNKDLDYAQAAHYVLGYNYNISPNWNFKTETYYQDLSKIGIGSGENSHVSLINTEGSSITTVPFKNEGKGKNYGIELTLEKYYSKNWFGMFTGSIYEAQYQNSDKVWKDARHNGNYAFNLLVGKEFNIGKPEKRRVLGLSGKVLWLGGKRYTPIDVDASILAGEEVMTTDYYGVKAEDVFKMDFAFYLRRNRKKTTHEFKIDIQNISNNLGKLDEFWNASEGKVEYNTQLPLLPVMMYTIDF